MPAGATVIQTNGRTILPGLVDMHLHLREWKVPMYLAYGVTTVGDIHNDTQWILAQRALLKSGAMKGPRLFVSGARVTGLGGPKLTCGQRDRRGSELRQGRGRGPRVHPVPRALGVDHVKVDCHDHRRAAGSGDRRSVEVQTSRAGPPPGYRRRHALRHEGDGASAAVPAGAARSREGKPLPQAGSEEGAELLLKVDPAKFAPLIRQMVEQGVIVDIALYGWVPREIWRAARPEIERLANDPGLAFVPAEEKKRG